MDVYHQVKHRLQAPHKVKKVISHWLQCGVDGRAYGHVTTKMDKQIFVPPGDDESFATTSMLSVQLLLFCLISGKCGW